MIRSDASRVMASVRPLLRLRTMKLQYFGDSYDIVKKSLIAWLGDFGAWSAHPMFTENVSPATARQFARFLGARLVSSERLVSSTNRTAYFSTCKNVGNLFLDPDTGIRLKSFGGAKSVGYIFGDELIDLVHTRPGNLTIVFDQSYSRGKQVAEIRHKLGVFASAGVRGFAYSSHAPFVILGGNAKLINQAHAKLLRVSGLPPSRIATSGAP